MISKEEVEGLAELARLKLTAEETAQLQKDISNILEYVGQVSAVSTKEGTGEKPVVRNVMRVDEPRQAADPLADKRDALLQALPKREGDYALVRKIIQKDE